MWRRSRRAEARHRVRGFSLTEALVSLIMIVIIMGVTMSLLFSMKSFAERQRVFTEPRQTARRATEYLRFYVSGAGDANDRAPGFSNPTAIISRFHVGSSVAPGVPRIASYNNLSSTQATAGFGTEATDVISLAIPSNPMKIRIEDFATYSATANQIAFNFRAGCSVNDTQNLNEFKKYTGAFGTAGNEKSGLLHLVDANGLWNYLQITSYTSSNCAATDDRVVTVSYLAGNQNQYLGSSGWLAGLAAGTGAKAFLVTGIQWVSFRLRNNAIEQKSDYVDASGDFHPGWFDPNVDGGVNSRFTRILDNIEDFQIAYVFPDGIVNNSVDGSGNPDNSLPTAQSGSPLQVIPTGCAAGSRDAGCVVALRVSIVARTGPVRLEALQVMERALLRRPASEDRGQGALDTDLTGYFQRYRMTSTMIIRNRFLGY